MLNAPGDRMVLRPKLHSCEVVQVAHTRTFHTCSTSQRRLPWRGAILTVPRRSVTRGPDRTQKPRSEQTPRGRWRADSSVQRYKKNVPCNASPCSTPRPWQAIQKSLLGLCTAIIDAQAARRRSLQTAFKQCLRTAEQHRAFLYLSAAADVHGGPADGSLCTSR